MVGKIVRGSGLGLIGGGAVGIVGAFLGDWLLPRFHIHFYSGLVGLVVSAAIGAIVLLLIFRLSGASGFGGGR